MDVTEFAIRGLVLLTPKKFADERGFVSETYNARHFEPHIGPVHFVQENHAVSEVAGTIRGLHFQIPPVAQGKLVRVVRGAAYDVAVDIRVGSPTFGHHVGIELTAENWTQFWIPPGFAHGFCTLEPRTEVVYKLTNPFSPVHDRGLAWNDPAVGINWPAIASGAVILSERDRGQPPLATLPGYFVST